MVGEGTGKRWWRGIYRVDLVAVFQIAGKFVCVSGIVEIAHASHEFSPFFFL